MRISRLESILNNEYVENNIHRNAGCDDTYR